MTTSPAMLYRIHDGRHITSTDRTIRRFRMRVFFMGTPEIAVPSLKKLSEKYDVCGVFCQPDKPVGRKHIITAPPVKVCAEELGIPVFQPKKMRDGTAAKIVRDLAPDVIAVIAYGRILPDEILEIPRYGCLNAHASLLPKYRGSAPIQYSLLNDEKETGVSIIKLVTEMDAGDVLYSTRMDIEDEYDSEYLFSRMGEDSADAFIEVIDNIDHYLENAVPQDHSMATFAPPITTEMSWMTFEDNARSAFCKIRAFCINPCARIMFRGKQLIVTKASFDPETGVPGTVLSTKPLKIAFSNGSVVFGIVKPEGGKLMDGTAFAAGQRLKAGDSVL